MSQFVIQSDRTSGTGLQDAATWVRMIDKFMAVTEPRLNWVVTPSGLVLARKYWIVSDFPKIFFPTGQGLRAVDIVKMFDWQEQQLTALKASFTGKDQENHAATIDDALTRLQFHRNEFAASRNFNKSSRATDVDPDSPRTRSPPGERTIQEAQPIASYFEQPAFASQKPPSASTNYL